MKLAPGRRRAAVAGGLAAVAGGAAAIFASTHGGAPRSVAPPLTEASVLAYILDHPDVLAEAADRVRARDNARAIAAHRRGLETPFAGAWAGDPEGDVALVEFVDYACGYCRISAPDVDRLLAEDRKLRLVFRALPILSEESDKAARISLAAARAGRFMGFHDALYRAGPLSAASVARVSAETGIAPRAAAASLTDRAIAAEIDGNLALAHALGVDGTPAFVVGDRLISGAVGYDALKRAIADVRAGRGKR